MVKEKRELTERLQLVSSDFESIQIEKDSLEEENRRLKD